MAAEFTPFAHALKSRLTSVAAPATPGTAPSIPVRSDNRAGASDTFSPISTAPSSEPPVAPAHTHQPVQLELKRDGDRISQIRIQCRCGELIEIDCDY